jgi:hypothetical protein
MRLVVLAGPDAGQEFLVPEPPHMMSEPYSIGRDPDNDAVLHDREVSRHHAEIRQMAGGYAITDLNSTNGTFVNDARVHESQPLHPGDKVRLGTTVLSCEEGAAEAVPAPEIAPRVEKRAGALPLIGVAAFAVIAILLIMLATGGGGPAVMPTSTPTAVAEPSLTFTAALVTSTPLPSPTVSPVPEQTATVTTAPPVLCVNPDIRITSPLPGARLSGTVEVFGTASTGGFDFYKLEYGVGPRPSVWSSIGEPTYSAARDARLGVWDTSVLPEGEYILRLTVVDTTGNFPPPCEVSVQIVR